MEKQLNKLQKCGEKIAGNARKDLEHEIGESVVTSNNSLNYEYVDEKEIEIKKNLYSYK